MNIKVIVCACDGLKFMPEAIDLNSLPLELEADHDITYAVTHPQLCGSGGVNFLQDVLRGARPDDYFVVAGCGAENQIHFLGHVVDAMRFPDERFLGVNIRGMDNVQARAAILEAIGCLLAKKNGMGLVDAFGG